MSAEFYIHVVVGHPHRPGAVLFSELWAPLENHFRDTGVQQKNFGDEIEIRRRALDTRISRKAAFLQRESEAVAREIENLVKIGHGATRSTHCRSPGYTSCNRRLRAQTNVRQQRSTPLICISEPT